MQFRLGIARATRTLFEDYGFEVNKFYPLGSSDEWIEYILVMTTQHMFRNVHLFNNITLLNYTYIKSCGLDMIQNKVYSVVGQKRV